MQGAGLGPLPTLLLLIAGVLGSIVAWGFLVRAAIAFGRAAVSSQPVAWAFCAGASLGAIGCLLLGFALVARLGRLLGLGSRRSAAGRRAAR